MILGEIIHDYRRQQQLSMDQFASLSGLTKGYISMLEKNQHPKTKKALLPTLETIEKIAKGMDIRPEQLIEQLDDQQLLGIILTAKDYLASLSRLELPPSLIEVASQLEGEAYEQWIAFGQQQVENLQNRSPKVLSLDDYRETVTIPVPGKVSAGTGYWQESDFDSSYSFLADELPEQGSYDTIAQVQGDSMEPLIADGDFLFIRLQPQLELNAIGIVSINGEQYVKKFKGDYFQSLNPDYEDIPIHETDQIRIIGKVVEIYQPD